MNHLHLIKVKYIAATDFQGARVKLTSTRHNKSKIIPFDYQFNNAMRVAINYIKKDLKYTIKATCNLDSNDSVYGVLVKEFSQFKPHHTVLDHDGKRRY